MIHELIFPVQSAISAKGTKKYKRLLGWESEWWFIFHAHHRYHFSIVKNKMKYVVIGVILLIAVFTFSLCKIAQKKDPKLFVVYRGRQKEKPSAQTMSRPLTDSSVKETYRETEGTSLSLPLSWTWDVTRHWSNRFWTMHSVSKIGKELLKLVETFYPEKFTRAFVRTTVVRADQYNKDCL